MLTKRQLNYYKDENIEKKPQGVGSPAQQLLLPPRPAPLPPSSPSHGLLRAAIRPLRSRGGCVDEPR